MYENHFVPKNESTSQSEEEEDELRVCVWCQELPTATFLIPSLVKTPWDTI